MNTGSPNAPGSDPNRTSTSPRPTEHPKPRGAHAGTTTGDLAAVTRFNRPLSVAAAQQLGSQEELEIPACRADHTTSGAGPGHGDATVDLTTL